jgi:hypothetical protein
MKTLAAVLLLTCVAFGQHNRQSQADITSLNLPHSAAVEVFGAKGDGTTDDTTAIQSCINSFATIGGVCTFQARAYKVTGTLTINKNSVGLVGVNSSNANSSVFAITPPGSQIISTSASADIVDVAGSDSSHTIGYNRIENLRLSRSVIPTGTAKGLSVVFTVFTSVKAVVSEDSIYGFYFKFLGDGLVRDSLAIWGQNGVSETTGSVYGFYFDSTGGVPSPSPLLDHDIASTNGAIPLVTSYGFYATGTLLADLYFSNTISFKMSYGMYFNNSGVGATASTDIHLVNPINDSCVTYCIQINGITGTLSITGGWSNASNGYTDNIDIESSTNVSIVNHKIFTSALATQPLYVTTRRTRSCPASRI